MSGFSIDLGITLDGGWPVHRWQCDSCEGRGYWGSSHDLGDSVDCHDCNGRGEVALDGCDCARCVALAHDYEMEQVANG